MDPSKGKVESCESRCWVPGEYRTLTADTRYFLAGIYAQRARWHPVRGDRKYGRNASCRECEKEPLRAYEVNALGSRNLAIVARELDAKLVRVSTDCVFDGAKAPTVRGRAPRRAT
jgi:RmlD substrate binding domain